MREREREREKERERGRDREVVITNTKERKCDVCCRDSVSLWTVCSFRMGLSIQLVCSTHSVTSQTSVISSSSWMMGREECVVIFLSEIIFNNFSQYALGWGIRENKIEIDHLCCRLTKIIHGRFSLFPNLVMIAVNNISIYLSIYLS